MAFAEGKLGKMTIIFYPSRFAPGVGGIVFTPMYNPATLAVNHTVKHERKPLTPLSDIDPKFIRTNPRTMSMELFFDNTGASNSTMVGKSTELLDNAIGPKASSVVLPKSSDLISSLSQGKIDPNAVDVQIQTFLKLGYQIAGTLHRPYYMMIIWGTFMMTAVLDSANVTYTMFAPDGRPLRAKMTVAVTESVDFSLKKKQLKFNSSDVSKSITVVAGDTLSLLCFKEYGDASLYSKIAEVNKLKNYRKLIPGMQLLFPPLTSIPA